MIDGPPLILIRQQLLDLPVPLLGPDAKLQIFLGDRIPVLVHHHDGQQVADGGEKQAVEIVLRALADRVADHVQNHLPDDEEEDPERDVAQGPAVLERVHHEDDLHDDVDEQADGVEQVQHHEQADRVRGCQPGFSLEGQDRDRAREQEHADGGAAEKPDGLRGAVLVELEADEAVDQEAGAEGGGEAVLHGGEVGVSVRARRDDARVEDQGCEGQHHVDVEESGDFFATYI